MRLQKTVIVDKPLDAVFNYLSDFTTTTEWDPGTVVTVNHRVHLSRHRPVSSPPCSGPPSSGSANKRRPACAKR